MAKYRTSRKNRLADAAVKTGAGMGMFFTSGAAMVPAAVIGLAAATSSEDCIASKVADGYVRTYEGIAYTHENAQKVQDGVEYANEQIGRAQRAHEHYESGMTKLDGATAEFTRRDISVTAIKGRIDSARDAYGELSCAEEELEDIVNADHTRGQEGLAVVETVGTEAAESYNAVTAHPYQSAGAGCLAAGPVWLVPTLLAYAAYKKVTGAWTRRRLRQLEKAHEGRSAALKPATATK